MSENIQEKINMNHKKDKHKKGLHRHDVINHVMSLLNWWTLGQGAGDFVVRHRRDRIPTIAETYISSTRIHKYDTSYNINMSALQDIPQIVAKSRQSCCALGDYL